MTLMFNSVLKATGTLTGQTTENRIRKTKTFTAHNNYSNRYIEQNITNK